MSGTWNPAIEAAFKFLGVDQFNSNAIEPRFFQSDRSHIPGNFNPTEKIVLDPMMRERIAITRRGVEAHQPGEEDVADIGSGLGD